MVARSVGHISNVDFSETFVPTSSAASVNISVAVANENRHLLRHLCLKQGFIQAHLYETVYMRRSGGCDDMIHELVLMQRAVYELRQADKTVRIATWWGSYAKNGHGI